MNLVSSENFTKLEQASYKKVNQLVTRLPNELIHRPGVNFQIHALVRSADPTVRGHDCAAINILNLVFQRQLAAR